MAALTPTTNALDLACQPAAAKASTRGRPTIAPATGAPVISAHELAARHAADSMWTDTASRLRSGEPRIELTPLGTPPPQGGLVGGIERGRLPETLGILWQDERIDALVPANLTEGMSDTRHNSVVHVLDADVQADRVEDTQSGRRFIFNIEPPRLSRSATWRVEVDLVEPGGQRHVDRCRIVDSATGRFFAQTPLIRSAIPDIRASATNVLRMGSLSHYTVSTDRLDWFGQLPASLQTAISEALQGRSATPPDVYIGRNTHEERGYLICRIDDAEGDHATVFFLEGSGRDDERVINPVRIRYRSTDPQTHVETTLNIPNPGFPHVQRRRQEVSAHRSAPSTASDLTVPSNPMSTLSVLGRRSRDDNDATSTTSVRDVRARFDGTRLGGPVFTVQPGPPFLLLAQPPGAGGCPAAVINHLFHAQLLKPDDLRSGPLHQTAQLVQQIGGTPMQYFGHPLNNDASYGDALVRATESVLHPLLSVCQAMFEVGNLSDPNRTGTHQIVLQLVADRQGQFGAADQSYWWVQDSIDPTAAQAATGPRQPAAMARRFGSLIEALDYIAQRSAQADDTVRMLSGYRPSTALPPGDAELTHGGIIPGVGLVQSQDLRPDERAQLQHRARQLTPPTHTALTPLAQRTDFDALMASLLSTSELEADFEWSAFMNEDAPASMEDPRVQIDGLADLRDPVNTTALSTYFLSYENPDPADSTLWDTPRRFLGALEARPQPLNVDSYMALTLRERRHIARDFISSHDGTIAQSARRQELASFLDWLYEQMDAEEWHNPPVPDNWSPDRAKPTWEDLILHYRGEPTGREKGALLTLPHRAALHKLVRQRAISGSPDSSIKTAAGTCAQVLRRLENRGTSLGAVRLLQGDERDALWRDKTLFKYGSEQTMLRQLAQEGGLVARRASAPEGARNRDDLRSAIAWFTQLARRGHTPNPSSSITFVHLNRLMAKAEATLKEQSVDPPPSLREKALSSDEAWQPLLESLGNVSTPMRAFRTYVHVEAFRDDPGRGQANDGRTAAAHVERWLSFRIENQRGSRRAWNLPEFASRSSDKDWNTEITTYLNHTWPDEQSVERLAAHDALTAFRTWERRLNGTNT